MHGIVDAVLALLDLDLGRAADADDGDAGGELGQPLLQLLAIVVGGGLLDLRLDLADAALISLFEPAPSTMVVFSFSITTFLARPSMLSVTFSSLMPRSSLIAVPPVLNPILRGWADYFRFCFGASHVFTTLDLRKQVEKTVEQVKEFQAVTTKAGEDVSKPIKDVFEKAMKDLKVA